jgi:hypothetical protein
MKPATLNDPMELVGIALPEGDARAMARCMVEEYLMLGWDERQLLLLFSRPCFRATHGLYLTLGEAGVRALIEEVRAQWMGQHNENEAHHA